MNKVYEEFLVNKYENERRCESADALIAVLNHYKNDHNKQLDAMNAFERHLNSIEYADILDYAKTAESYRHIKNACQPATLEYNTFWWCSLYFEERYEKALKNENFVRSL